MENNKNNNKQQKTKVDLKPVKKRKKITQKNVIQIVAIVLVVAFLLGILSTTVAYIFYNSNKTPGSNIINYDQNQKADLLAQEIELTALYKKEPENNENLLQLIQVYSELGYIYRRDGDEAKATEYFLNAVKLSEKLKVSNPSMSISADYLIAGNYAEAGKLAEAEAIILDIISKNVDPLNSRVIYAEFLLNKKKDQTGASAQIDAALAAAKTPEEKDYVNNLVTQYGLR